MANDVPCIKCGFNETLHDLEILALNDHIRPNNGEDRTPDYPLSIYECIDQLKDPFGTSYEPEHLEDHLKWKPQAGDVVTAENP